MKETYFHAIMRAIAITAFLNLIAIWGPENFAFSSAPNGLLTRLKQAFSAQNNTSLNDLDRAFIASIDANDIVKILKKRVEEAKIQELIVALQELNAQYFRLMRKKERAPSPTVERDLENLRIRRAQIESDHYTHLS
jgi:hypothetical protein